jgi:LPXTG-motif cell wall-anchored protein
VLGVAPNLASAGLGISSAPIFPTTVTVGDTTLPAAIELTNQNTGNDVNVANTVCNNGDGLPCPVGDPGITLTPSCGALGTFSICTIDDPGVFRISPTATGAAGSACAGMTFTITLIDATKDLYRVVPDGGAHVTLPVNGSVCRIDFTVDVLKMPTVDQNPGVAGVQTVQVVDSTHVAANQSASARGTSTGVTAIKAQPAITTLASPTVDLGGQVHDTATVTGRVSPVAGATVTFRLFAVDDTTCSGAPVLTSTVPIGADGTATSGAYTADRSGQHRWIATYDGDANNAPVSGVCSDATEMVTVRHVPTIATVASPTVSLGIDISDSATVSGLVNPDPAATVRFDLYAPSDPTCAAAPIASSVASIAIAADGTTATATAQAYRSTVVGTYRWIATFSGDANNASVSGLCSDPSESVVVTGPPVPPQLLPATGHDVSWMVAIGSALLGAGLALLASASRRRSSHLA